MSILCRLHVCVQPVAIKYQKVLFGYKDKAITFICFKLVYCGVADNNFVIFVGNICSWLFKLALFSPEKYQSRLLQIWISLLHFFFDRSTIQISTSSTFWKLPSIGNLSRNWGTCKSCGFTSALTVLCSVVR